METPDLPRDLQIWSPYVCRYQGKEHPGSIVESHALAAVNPPPVDYPIHETLGAQIADGTLSNVQLEGIALACRRHLHILPDSRRAGFFMADAAGVGKGRQIAGVVLDNMFRGRRRALWCSSSRDLFDDATRDFREINSDVRVVAVMDESIKTTMDDACVLFMTYSELTNPSKMERARAFLCKNTTETEFEGVIVFDECHRAKRYGLGGSSTTKTGEAVYELQQSLPNARVVYASATGIASLSDMGYMTRMGLWGHGTTFPTFSDFASVGGGACSVLETLAVQFKASGCHVARRGGMGGTEFARVVVSTDEAMQNMYSQCSRIWHETMSSLLKCASLCRNRPGNVSFSNFAQDSLRAFWAAHQRFTRQFLSCIKVREVVRRAKVHLAEGRSVVIGIQDTGETSIRRSEMYEGGVTRMASVCRDILRTFIVERFETKRRWAKRATDPDRILHEDDYYLAALTLDKVAALHRIPSASFAETVLPYALPALTADANGSLAYRPDGTIPECIKIRRELLEKVEAAEFPPCALDDIIDRLGGPSVVAELTGRESRQVRGADGEVRMERRSLSASYDKKRAAWSAGFPRTVNGQETVMFMNGDKRVAIVSDAASTGISLHADANVPNQDRRVHMTMEFAWSAEKTLQQLGRTNRTNQTSSPMYETVSTDMAGEKRFEIDLARKMKTLGAVTHGDRRVLSDSDPLFSDDAISARVIPNLLAGIARGQFGPGVDAQAAVARAAPHMRTLGTPAEVENTLLRDVAHGAKCLEGRCTARCARMRTLADHAEACRDDACDSCTPAIREVVAHSRNCFIPSCKACFGESVWCPLPREWTMQSVMDALIDGLAAMKEDERFGRWENIDARVMRMGGMGLAFFLNRIMILPPAHQSLMYEFFVECRSALRAASDFERLPLVGLGELVESMGDPVPLFRDPGTGSMLTMSRMRRNRGCTFAEVFGEARRKAGLAPGDLTQAEFDLVMAAAPRARFYVHRKTREVVYGIRGAPPSRELLRTVRPSTCRDTFNDVIRYRGDWVESADMADVAKRWDDEYRLTERMCIHGGTCGCNVGKRVGEFGVVSGCIASVWNRLQSHLSKIKSKDVEWTMRLKTFSLIGGERVVGVTWPLEHAKALGEVVDRWRNDVRATKRTVTVDVPILGDPRSVAGYTRESYDAWMVSLESDAALARAVSFTLNPLTNSVTSSAVEGVLPGYELVRFNDRVVPPGTLGAYVRRMLMYAPRATVRIAFVRPYTEAEKTEEDRFERYGMRCDEPGRVFGSIHHHPSLKKQR